VSSTPLLVIFASDKHRSKRFIAFLSAGIMSGAFGSIVSGAITSSIDGAHGIAGWRWLFIVEGVATCAASLVAPYFLLDYPATSKRLTPEERILACRRLEQDGVTSPGNEDRVGHFRAFTGAVLNWRVWLLAIAYMTIIGSLSLSYFYPTLVGGLGYTSTTAQYVPLFPCSRPRLTRCKIHDSTSFRSCISHRAADVLFCRYGP
jgi:MFS family permease